MTYAQRHPWVTAFAGVAFFFLVTALIGTNQDEAAEKATAESVADLGRQMRIDQPKAATDPLIGHPYKELCRDVGQGKEICR